MPGDVCTAPEIISLSPLSLATDVTDATLGASGLRPETRTGAGGTATVTESFLVAAHGSVDNRSPLPINTLFFHLRGFMNIALHSRVPFRD